MVVCRGILAAVFQRVAWWPAPRVFWSDGLIKAPWLPLLFTNGFSTGAANHPEPVERCKNRILGDRVDCQKGIHADLPLRRANDTLSQHFGSDEDLQIRHQGHVIAGWEIAVGAEPSMRRLWVEAVRAKRHSLASANRGVRFGWPRIPMCIRWPEIVARTGKRAVMEMFRHQLREDQGYIARQLLKSAL